jgi:hypothetical protein
VCREIFKKISKSKIFHKFKGCKECDRGLKYLKKQSSGRIAVKIIKEEKFIFFNGRMDEVHSRGSDISHHYRYGEFTQGLTFEVLRTSRIREILIIEHGGIRILEGQI